MTQDKYEQLRRDGEVQMHALSELGIGTDDGKAPRPAGYTFDDFLPLLFEMLAPKQHLEAAPTFTPRNLLEQVQLMDDGVDLRLYVFVNGAWRYATLT